MSIYGSRDTCGSHSDYRNMLSSLLEPPHTTLSLVAHQRIERKMTQKKFYFRNSLKRVTSLFLSLFFDDKIERMVWREGRKRGIRIVEMQATPIESNFYHFLFFVHYHYSLLLSHEKKKKLTLVRIPLFLNTLAMLLAYSSSLSGSTSLCGIGTMTTCCGATAGGIINP
jgi:hypothetical protein